MKKITLYQIDSLERTRVWNIWTEESKEGWNIITSDGLKDGKLSGSITSILAGKGKKTVEQQAESEAMSKAKKKIKEGWVEDITKMKKRGETATIPEPMKGRRYHPTGKQSNSKTLASLGIIGNRAILDSKLDGFRFRVKLNKTGITSYSSSGDIIPNYPHIDKRLMEVYNTNPEKYENIILDGEIYNHELKKEFGFNIIQEAAGTKVHLTPEKLALRAKMQFYLFDVVLDDEPILKRLEFIEPFFDDINIKRTKWSEVYLSDEIIQETFDRLTSEGYEGVMIKLLNFPYEHKRSKGNLKYKPEEDDEFKVIGYEESRNKNTLGALICDNGEGKSFKADLSNDLGDDKTKAKLWIDRENLIGKWVECRYMEKSIDNIPRFAKAKRFRQGKSID